MESLKHKLTHGKEIHVLTWSKYVLFWAKATKWKGKAIYKSKNLTKAMSELKHYASHMEELEKAKKKAKVNLEASNHKVSKIKKVEEKAKHELNAIAE